MSTLALLTLLMAIHFASSDQGFGVYNGAITSWADYPYMASIRYNYEEGQASEHCCAGTIVSLDPPAILTAAHCVYDGDDREERQCNREVMIGCDHALCNTNEQAVAYQVDAVYVHEQFVHLDHYDQPPQYDIALLKLYPAITQPSDARNISNIGQGDPCCQEFHPLTVLGYGRTRALSVYTNLRNGTENYLRQTECNAITETDYYNYESMICFMDEWDVEDEAVAVCAGDNGGPIVNNRGGVETLVGVTSWEWTNFIGYVCNVTAPQTAANVGTLYPW
eukprot:194076_1